MIHTWIADVTPLMEDAVYERYFRELPTWRKEKANRLQNANAKALSVGVWTLYEQAKTRHRGIQTFNLSHSGKYALCSFTCEDNCQVGCDIQEMQTTQKATDSLAKRFFTEQEYAYIAQGVKQETCTQRFYRLWVLKESFAKATKEGLGIGFVNFDVGFDTKDEPVLREKPKRITRQYYFKEYFLEDKNYKIAICATVNQFTERLKVVKLKG